MFSGWCRFAGNPSGLVERMQVYEVAVDGKTNKPSATTSAVVAPAPVTEGGRNQLRA